MSEVCTQPIYGLDEEGEQTVTFTDAHTWADIVRWIAANPVDRYEVLRLLQEDKENEGKKTAGHC